MGDIVDRGDGDDDEGPDGGDKQSQMERQGKGVERGMVVEMAPRLGTKDLDAAVDDCRGGHEQTETGGIERRDIVEVDNLGTQPHEPSHAIGGDNDHTEGHILGGDSIRSFSFAMILGVVFGTLSSLFIAAPTAFLIMGRTIRETDSDVANA